MIRAKKSFGQHFLKSQKVVRAIIEAAEIESGETIVEVGPGTGVLTRALVSTGAHVIAIEADRDLIPALRSEFGDPPSPRLRGAGTIELIEGDALRLATDVAVCTADVAVCTADVAVCTADVACNVPTYKFVSNLPYNVGTEILERFLTSKHPPERCVVMVQKEVGERMLAKPGEMSLLSLAVQLYTDPKRVLRVPPGAFAPPPKVDSLVVRLDRNPKCADPPRRGSGPSAEAVMAVAKAGFRARRKQLHRNLADAGIMASEKTKEWLRSCGLSEKARAQELSVKDWVELVKFQSTSIK